MVVVIEVLSATALVFASSPLLLVRSAAMASARGRATRLGFPVPVPAGDSTSGIRRNVWHIPNPRGFV